MNKIKKFLRKLKNNAGSSIVMVVVSIAFIGIIVGALLAAAVQSYRLKLQELNAKDNFYYVEQAMNEVYAGVGTQTVEDLQDAYVYTVENMVSYDLSKGRYVTKTQEEAQKVFSQKFYNELQQNPFFKVSQSELVKKLSSFISNDTVVLDGSRITVEDYKNDKNELVGKIIRNVKVSRTQDYNRNSANGTYVQSITTDIVIGDPDFSVVFDSINDDDPNIFKYALVADMGVVVDQKTTPLTIAGNVYAAADYYNKQYNESTWNKDADKTSDHRYVNKDNKTTYEVEQKDGKKVDLSDLYTHGAVTSKLALDEKTSANYTYYDNDGKGTIATKDYYDGESIKSKYSGFYVNGSQVSIVADSVVVPGTMAVMDKGSLSVYGKSGSQTAQAEVWTDNIVLDGYSTINEKANDKTGTIVTTYDGAEAIMKANLYVKDDTEVNAAGATFQLTGSYFGYGDSTEKDSRKFTGVVNADNFQVEVLDENGNPVKDADGNVQKENRGHYNSSAIIVNGEQSTLNLSQAQTLFLAGRTYIELSKDVNTANGTVEETVQDPLNPAKKVTVTKKTVTDTYSYHPTDYNAEMPANLRTDKNATTTIRDYKMGESISVKSNQQAYVPVTYNGIPTLATDSKGVSLGYYLAELPPALKGVSIFETYFPVEVYNGKVPCILQLISNKDSSDRTKLDKESGKKYYYYDFDTAYEDVKAYNQKKLSAAKMDEWLAKYPSAQYFASGFISDYSAELQKHKTYVNATNKAGLTDSDIAAYLVDISDYEDFESGDIILPDTEINKNASIYSSGAITTKKDTTFSIVRADDTDVVEKLLTSDGLKEMNAGNNWVGSVDSSDETQVYSDAYQLSNNLEMEYDLMKWNLGHFDSTDENSNTEKQYIQDLVNDKDFGDAIITPINKFVDMSQIGAKTNIMPNMSDTDSGENVLKLASGYSVWVSNDDVVIQARPTDNGKVRGIVVTKGNVYFSTDATNHNAVTDFEGMIIAGGKVYVNGNVKTLAANAELCRTILRECLLNGDANAKLVSSLFRGYEPSDNSSDTSGDETATTGDATPKSIDMIDYTDVVSFSNWMKNVE